MFKMILLCLFLVSFCNGQFLYGNNKFKYMEKVFSWKQIGYDIDGDKYTEDADYSLKSDPDIGDDELDDLEDEDVFFTKYDNVPFGLEAYEDRVFITVPRRAYGIPSTLNYLDIKSSDSLLKPYPNSESMEDLVSVYRPRVDVCDRLWVVDTGLLEVSNHFEQKQPPRIIVYDLKTNKEVMKYEIPSDVLVNGTTSGLTSITVDVTPTTCDDAYAYIPDFVKSGLIVFSMKQKSSWRFSHSSFDYDDAASGFNIGNSWVEWRHSLFSVALSNPNKEGIRTAYYHPFGSTLEFSVTTDILKNKSADIENHYKREGVRGAFSQSGSHDYHSETGVLFYANLVQDGVMCWNTKKLLFSKISALIVQDQQQLLHISDLKVRGDDVWVLSNKLSIYMHYFLEPTETNYYLFKGKVQDLIQDTDCDV